MLESIRLIFKRNSYPELMKFHNELEEHRVASNNKRCELLAKALIFLNLLLILMDLIMYKSMWFKIPAYIYLLYSHLVILIVLPIWLLLLNAKRKYNLNISENILSKSLFYIVIS